MNTAYVTGWLTLESSLARLMERYSVEFFLNSGYVINHQGMNWGPFEDFPYYIVLLVTHTRGCRFKYFFRVIINVLIAESSKFSENI